MPEQQNIEWKQSWRDEYLKWISGFANANGGTLYIGKNDNGIVVGVNNSKKLMDELPNKVRDTTGMICEINLYDENDKYFIEIVVEPMTVPISYKGKFYLRSGSTNQLLNGISLDDFLLRKRNLTWDEITINEVSIEDIDENAIEYFKRKAIETGRIPSIDDSTDTETILKKLDLIDKDGKYTRASILLFAKNPIKYFKTAYLKIGKFGSSYTELLHQDVIESNGFELANRTIEILDTKYIIRNISYDGLSRIETPEYPFEAIRELLFNAIIHKRYNTAPITVRVFDDRIEISNIGMLPIELTPEDLKMPHNSFPRNKLMASVFYKGGHIEAWGRGTLKVIDECKKHGLPEPLIEEKSGGLWVTIFKDIYNEKYLSKLDINDRQKQAIQFVKNNEYITSTIYEREYKITRRTAIRDLEKLMEIKILKKDGSGKSTRYIIDVNGCVF